MKSIMLCTIVIAICLLGASRAAAQQTTVFTYQGQLRDGGTNANGTYTMIFKLYDAVSGGGQIGSTLSTSPTLANGLFTVNLDFGAGAFNGTGRWLDITVAGDALTPRVQVLPAPYALYAAVAGTVTNGAIMNAHLAGNTVSTTNVQNGAITTMQIAAGAVTNANLTANAVATGNIQNSAVTTSKIADGNVTDVKIVSVSGSKVSGAVASANVATSAGSATTAGSATSAGTATLANSVAAGSITTASLQDGAVNAAKIASGQVVKGLNGLTDFVAFAAGKNITLTTNANGFEISASITNSSLIVGNETSLTIIGGFVSASGSSALGSGFASSKPSFGHYSVTFNTPFSRPPVVVVSPNSFSGITVGTQGTTSSSFDVVASQRFFDGTNMMTVNTNDVSWEFIAIGPQ